MTLIDPTAVIAMLNSTPRRIASVTLGLSDKDLIWKPSPDSWSVNEVIVHLRACADVWGDSILMILREDTPTFRYVSPRTWIRKTNYPQSDFQASFLAFRRQRDELLKALQPLAHEDWLRRAIVRATKPREETVLSYAHRLAGHEAGHCDQINRILHALRRG